MLEMCNPQYYFSVYEHKAKTSSDAPVNTAIIASSDEVFVCLRWLLVSLLVPL